MRFSTFHRKSIALGFLLLMISEVFTPSFAYALTSGPSQPETSGFEPIGNSDMVELFSGDFSYNVPLMDVGGYPVNLAYHSGANMDEEASWVGYGWSLNVGSLNRQLRGLPDDFNGTDKQERTFKMKDHVVKGGKFSVTLDLLGIPVLNIKKKVKKKKLDLAAPTLSAGVTYDNYRGIAVDLGANAGVSLTDYVAGDKSSGSKDSAVGGLKVGNIGLNLSSADGASINFNRSIFSKNLDQADKTSISKSIGFGYNTRQGLAGMTLSNSFSSSKILKDKPRSYEFNINSSFISFNGESYTPSIDHPTKTEGYTFSLHLAPELFVAFPGIGATGFYSKQSTSETVRRLPSYGYLYGEGSKEDAYALQDMNREKDIPYSKEVKYLPIPVPTYDLFSATSQDGAGQYRAYRGSSSVYFDPKTEMKSDNLSVGIEFGPGSYFDVGADLYKQDIKTVTKKWKDRNNFLSKGDFQKKSASADEPVYFKRVGEPVPSDKDYFSTLKGSAPFAVSLPRKIDNGIEGAKASDKVRTTSAKEEAISVLKRNKREVRNTTFSYLTAKEASAHALDKKIKDYNPDSLVYGDCNTGGVKTAIPRNSGYRKGHHISEVTITGDDGKRSIYGLPVYNTYQEEVSFSVRADTTARKKGLIHYDSTDNGLKNDKGLENYYSKEVTPPYATSYLLTGILSPDYVDKTGNGISDDDLGTAVKFNYSRLNSLYNWRTPYASGSNFANYNEGFLSDTLDDKANYVYGQKEVWYLHSIESKTMVAHFITEDRSDALGVQGDSGLVNTSTHLKRLKEIRLYSKSDLKLAGGDPSKTTPIKVVHFVYNYSICRGLPNSENGAGKLTLEKVYFTFGHNNKGSLYPYQFSYDTTYNQYDYRQYDRWGNFKDAAFNPGGLNNSEFPYVLQDSALARQFASIGQLTKITLPSGGSINVQYESDDYGYVQDRRASEMCFISGVGVDGSATGLIDAEYVYVKLPKPANNSEDLRRKYFEGVDKLYFKFFMDLDGRGRKEFVPGYAQIAEPPMLNPGSRTVAKIRLKRIGGKNPMAKAGWQFFRMSLPKYAYPGSEDIESKDTDLKKTVKALVTAFTNIKELLYGYEKRAANKKYCDAIDLQKSWVRLCSPEKKKFGGGARVRRIDISDNWAQMSGTAGAKTAVYSQLYDYTTTDERGTIISSGVAAYEPSVGNDENPFRQPLNYKQNQFLGLSNLFYIEEPFGESFFPAANVGYSKVSIKSIGTGDDESVNRTGTSVSEFYTAKDYPTKISILGLEEQIPKIGKLFKLIGGSSYDMIGLSQGYSIELNDMHGKPKSVNISNKSGKNISSVVYFYKTTNEAVEKKELSNEVSVIERSGTIGQSNIGMDVEVYHDMREQTTNNLGVSIKVSGGAGSILFFPLPFFFPGIGANYDQRSYRASSTVKIINRFAVQYKVTKVQDGSSITTENLLWDAETGNVLLTKTQNEFDDPIYSFAYPAHWAYDGMGQAYQNLGTILSGFSTGADGTISNGSYGSLLTPGDELVDINSSSKYWVINSPVGTSYQKRIVDQAGNFPMLSSANLKLVRSGRRNMANTAITTLTSLKSPIVGDKLDASVLNKVLDSKATEFSDEWEMPYYCATCPSGYTIAPDGQSCYIETDPTVNSGCYTVCQGSHDGSYSVGGTEIYGPGYLTDGTGQVIWSVTSSLNRLWVGGPCPPPPPPPQDISIANQSSSSPTMSQENASLSENTYASKEDSLAAVNGNSSTIQSKTATTSFSHNLAAPSDPCALSPGSAWNTEFCGPLHRTSIWSCQGNGVPLNTWLGFSKCINVAATKTYYIGIAGDNGVRFYVDGVLKLSLLDCSSDAPFRKWRIYPISLEAGQHIIEMEGYNCGGDAAFGAEIYDNTVTQLSTATDTTQLNRIFTTRQMVGSQFDKGHYSCPAGYALNTCTDPFKCRSIVPANAVVNPYFTGLKGNWRPKSQYVYQVNREHLTPTSTQATSTDIRKSGAYAIFSPFWTYSGGGWNKSSDARWIAASEVTYFNEKGTEVENKDALGRFSAAQFGYLQSMPVAVASNARYREIGYDGFEDYNFTLDCASSQACSDSGHFNFKKGLSSEASLSTQEAHSGKYSLSLNGSVVLNRSVFVNSSSPLYSFDNTGRYLRGSNELSKGFSPIPGKKYVLSFWIKDNNPRNPSASITTYVNGVSLVNNLAKWPVVDGWKRVEVPFVLNALSTSFRLQFTAPNCFLDDVRINPFDGQMKSFAYDPSSQRLMAELDENNFATFYEYDDEGILVRVKKETERGVMTIKETRSGYRKI